MKERKIVTKQNGEFTLNNDQFKVCSAIATEVSNIQAAYSSDEYLASKIEQWQYKRQGISWAATLIGVPWQVIYDIEINKNIKGYINLNRISNVVYFE